MKIQQWAVVALALGALLVLSLRNRVAVPGPLPGSSVAPAGKGDPTHPKDFLKDPNSKPDPRVGPDATAGPDANARPDAHAP